MIHRDRTFLPVECPACGAMGEYVRRSSDAALIVCRNCGERWPDTPGGKNDAAPDRRALTSGPSTIEAERRPLVSYSRGSDRAWAAKVEGDWWPEPPQRSQIPMRAAAIAGAAFLCAFFLAREGAVTTLPDLAGLYEGLGLPVNLDNLTIEGVTAERQPDTEFARVIVKGTIRNASDSEHAVLALTASVHTADVAAAGWRDFEPPARIMAAGEAAPFELALDGVPRQAERIVIRFRRPSETAVGPGKPPEGNGRTQ